MPKRVVLSELSELIKDEGPTKGVHIGVYNHPLGNIYGLEAGLFNSNIDAPYTHGLEVAISNSDFYCSAHCGAQIAAVANAASTVTGAQIAAVFNAADVMDGVQIGLFNYVGLTLRGIQIGLICRASEGKYLQLGLLTIRNKGPLYKKVTPLIGWSKD